MRTIINRLNVRASTGHDQGKLRAGSEHVGGRYRADSGYIYCRLRWVMSEFMWCWRVVAERIDS